MFCSEATKNDIMMKKKEIKKKLHCPGIEPGSKAWKALMLPLHQQCFTFFSSYVIL